jgi:hypothetical protein
MEQLKIPNSKSPIPNGSIGLTTLSQACPERGRMGRRANHNDQSASGGPNLFCVLVIWYWDLKCVCNLVLGIWDLLHSIPPLLQRYLEKIFETPSGGRLKAGPSGPDS